jgi:hypothetical protein
VANQPSWMRRRPPPKGSVISSKERPRPGGSTPRIRPHPTTATLSLLLRAGADPVIDY